ncbi:LEAF RUST 10 DISEASE-RESISTANCE LOCUS RECEPTOR-LIKE PROTEIN KINASE-like 2.4 isoform X2 [Alnus glutinosa]|uniref:LEAF RUST 10 DISEASE-RESISTANCE LOCUS RECEPTOR-LIKE PROTEIN KINASE-like 2.4 isoform X2 n=1 Tax=Alnus glutinosa TaxID=3517 RepID=UPI002D770884|nr:LEAF RUST 10 DISEASE-RESISTANCE LOCUS RECEPTOR-LIKE PROTEIN KINASE-like 2.4 isoform X2 [Alnus glutinosa]
MDPWLSFQSTFLVLVFVIFMVFVEVPVSLCSYDWYSSCSNRFDCGHITGVGYPFWGDRRPEGCGHPDLELKCSRNITTIEIKKVTYRVLDAYPSTKILKIVRKDYLVGGICSTDFVNTTLDSEFFDYSPDYVNITLLYGCPPPSIPSPLYFSCPSPDSCAKSVVVPVLFGTDHYQGTPNLSTIEETIKGGFYVKWKEDAACSACTGSKGVCGYDPSKNQPTCYCPNQPNGLPCGAGAPQAPTSASGKSKRNTVPLALGIAIGGGIAVVISFVIICSIKRGYFTSNSMVWWKRDAKDNHFKTEEIIKSYGLLAPKRYTYSDVKKLTNSFKEKVGQGGYGVVYKGKLPDGRMVAVKILSASKGNGEEFINEVASISRTSHVNIVALLGFCYERTKSALIYEFMPYGSLDKFIYDKGHPITNCHLDSNTMFQIAVGIARGLEYLHRGCNTRILHFDIKPHNILLDEDLRPKISDFGLAKLCKTKESIVSMTGMRGTAGYIAPEVFSRYFGGVSHKSDVYSYGMLVLEMVGARKEIDSELSQTSKTYFPHGIYNKLEQGESFVTLGDITEEEEDTIKKMIMVSLWCIQTNPSDRPSIGKVIEMLEGSLQSLQFPPKPVMHSPVRSPQDSSTTSQSQNPTF